jgi:hypothetical protein
MHRLRAGMDHQRLCLKLLKRPSQVLGFRVPGRKGKYLQVALSIPHRAGEIIQLQQANVTVVILKRFNLQPGTILGLQRVTVILAFMFAHIL